MNRYVRCALLGTVLGVSALTVIYLELKKEPTVYREDKESQGTPNLGGPFILTDQYNQKRTDTDFQGKIKLIYFGYTFCPDVCPMGLDNMTKALNMMGRDISHIAPIFISVDPERDTVPALKEYAAHWHSSFVFLTGDRPAVEKAMSAYKVYAAKATPDGTSADYLVDHSTVVYVMDASGKFIEALSHSSPPEQIAAALQKALLAEQG